MDGRPILSEARMRIRGFSRPAGKFSAADSMCTGTDRGHTRQIMNWIAPH